MNKKLLVTGLIFGVLSIILGALAAHALEKQIDRAAILTFETGVRYQMYHALLMLLLGATSFVTKKTKALVFSLIVAGLLFFSGSIYGLATNNLTSFDFKSIALLTPIGGLLLVLAWLVLLINIFKTKMD
jgi:uncharacterized membrane protein YgdD (TMEM256/DUF423 family)